MLKAITTKDKRTNLEKEIDEVWEVLRGEKPNTEDYEALMSYIERLYKLKAFDTRQQVSPDTLAVVAGNLLGIGLILNYEKLGTITSKALGLVIRGRV